MNVGCIGALAGARAEYGWRFIIWDVKGSCRRQAETGCAATHACLQRAPFNTVRQVVLRWIGHPAGQRSASWIAIPLRVSARMAPMTATYPVLSEYPFRPIRGPRSARPSVRTTRRGRSPWHSVASRVRAGERGLSSLGRRVRPGRRAAPDDLQAGRSGSVRRAADSTGGRAQTKRGGSRPRPSPGRPPPPDPQSGGSTGLSPRPARDGWPAVQPERGPGLGRRRLGASKGNGV